MGSLEIACSKTMAAAGVMLALFGVVCTANASPNYPPEVQKAMEQQFKGQTFCVPQCVTCHLTNEGGFHTLNVFGNNLQRYGRLPSGNAGQVVGAFDTYFKSNPPTDAPQVNTVFVDGTSRPFFDSDQDGISDYTELQNSDSPSLALPRGEKEFCPDILYGCFARVAPARPPADRLGLISFGAALLGLAALRKLKRAPRAN